MGDDEFKSERRLKDYTSVVDRELPGLTGRDPARLSANLEGLLALEKATRLAGDTDSSLRVVEAMLELIHSQGDWTLLGEYVGLLCKRRAQMQKVVQRVVRLGCGWVDEVVDEKAREGLICVLRDVSEGRMFVELERARLTRKLAAMKEKRGDTSDAADLLQDVQVETIGAMDVREKADMLLEQVRLCLAKGDHVRAEIIARKIKESVLDADEMRDLKLRYNELMAGFYTHQRDYTSVSRSYWNIFSTREKFPAEHEEAAVLDALRMAVIYLVLAPHDAEVAQLLASIRMAKKRLAKLPDEKKVLDMFSTRELMFWPLPVDAAWRSYPTFSDKERGEERYKLMHKRVVQANVRTIAGVYKRARLGRVADMLQVKPDEAEQHISDMVSSGQLYARIDRPAGIVTFERKQTANSIVHEWSHDIGQLLSVVEKTCHLISKENMLHAIADQKA